MLGRKFRLTANDVREISRLRRNSKEVHSAAFSGFSLHMRENHRGHNRFAVIIGASVARSSVKRHALKRQIMEIVRQWPISKRDFLIVVSPHIVRISNLEIKNEFFRAAKTLI